jgi:hypothetical protein
MSRLFVTPREQHFIADIAKEYMKDVVGQKILYFPISVAKSKVHRVYNEAIQKVFENPISVFAHIGQPTWEAKQDQFGVNAQGKLELFLHARDLIDKGFTPSEGDFFKYGGTFWEIMSIVNDGNIFGQDEYDNDYKVSARSARLNQFSFTESSEYDKDKQNFQEAPIQKVFEQQRGLPETLSGVPTGDFRQMRDRLGDEMAPIALEEGPRTVDEADNTPDDNNEKASSFNNESVKAKRSIYR